MTCLCRHRGEAEVYVQPIRNPALEGGGWSAPCSGHFTPWKDQVPIQDAGWASGPVWMARKISPAPGFDPQTVRPVASRYTD